MKNILIKIDSKKELYKKLNSLIEILVVKNDKERDSFLLSKMGKDIKDKFILDIGFAEHKIEYVLQDQWFHRKLRKTFANVFGIDYESNLVAEISSLTNYNNLYTFDATKPIPLEKKFDVIHAGDILEHVLNIEGLFNNFHNLLDQDGKIIISTPNPQSYYYVKDLLVNGLAIPNSNHVLWIDPGNMFEICERAGFVIEKIYAPISPKRNLISFLQVVFPGIKKFMAGEYIYILKK